MTCEGWTNYATWNIALWVNNDYGLYQAQCEMLDELDRPVTAEDAQTFFTDYMDGTTPDIEGNDREGGRIEDVNWQEIADHWEIERLEREEEKR